MIFNLLKNSVRFGKRLSALLLVLCCLVSFNVQTLYAQNQEKKPSGQAQTNKVPAIANSPSPEKAKAAINKALENLKLYNTNNPNSTTSNVILAKGFPHNRFGRLIFKFKEDNDYKVVRKGDLLSITFDKDISINLDEIIIPIQKHIAAASIDKDNNKIVHLLLTQDNARVRKFYGKNFVGFDVIEPKLSPEEKKLQLLKSAPKPVNKPSFEIAEINSEIEKLKQTLEKEKKKSAIENIWLRVFPKNKPSFLESFFTTEGAPRKKPINPEAEAQKRIRELEAKKQEEIEIAKMELQQKLQKLRESRETRIIKAKEDLKNQELLKRKGITLKQLEEEKRREQALLAAQEAERRSRILIPVEEKLETAGAVRIVFPWTKPVASSVFVRGNYVWVIFNKSTVLDFEDMPTMTYFSEVQEVEGENFTVLKFKVKDNYILSGLHPTKERLQINVKLAGIRWEMDIKKETLASMEGAEIIENPVQVNIGPSKQGPKVFLTAKNPSEVLSIIDSEVGDTLHIAPMYQPSVAVIVERDFIDFKLPPTLQGIVVIQKSDGVLYKTHKEGLEIYSSNQLYISQDLFLAGTEETVEAKPLRQRKIVLVTETVLPFNYLPLGLEKLADGSAYEEEESEEQEASNEETPDGAEKAHTAKKKKGQRVITSDGYTVKDLERISEMGFIDKRRELYKNLLKADKETKTYKRVEIAKYYFSLKMYEEALGMAREIKIIDPIYEQMQEVDLMIAACKYLIGRYREAEEDFSSLAAEVKGHESFEEISLWKWMSMFQHALLARKKIESDLPIDFVVSYERFMQKYPEDLRYNIGLLFAQFMVKQNLLDEANGILESISFNGIPEGLENDTKFIRGLIAAQADEIDKAISLWEPLSHEIEDRYNRARAIYELAKLRLINGVISPTEAIEDFNIVGSIWRGDNLELDVLKLIGQLYIKEKEYMKGLTAWQTLVTNFPNTKESLFIAGKMKQTFVELFDAGEAYKLNPFDALSLYFSFRELTPVGDIGDRITQQLAEHFINADLLDNAANIISHQIRFRTTGDLKHLLTLKLAKLYLENKKPVEAIKAINSVKDDSEIRPSVANALRYQEALAYQKLGEAEKVFELLYNDFSPDAQNIRLNTFWKKKNWFGVMDIVEPRLPQLREEGRVDLTEMETQQVIKLLVSYRMQEEFDKIKQMRQDFSEKIIDPELLKVFNFVADDVKTLNFEDFSNTIQLDEIEDFILEYAVWPSKEWASIATLLAPKVDALREKEYLSDADRDLIVRLAIAYAMQMEDLESDVGRDSKRKLSELQRDFRDVTINQTTIRVLKILDKRFVPKQDDVVFKGNIALKDLPDFIKIYDSVDKYSQLNAAVEQQ